MKKNQLKHNKGFTLIETLIAILILTLSIGALLSLAAGGYFSVRYSRNQIVANNLLQESIEYIRNSRDTAFQKGQNWTDWQVNSLLVDKNGASGTGGQGCFSNNGCYVDPYALVSQIKECADGGCPPIVYFTDNGIYGYAENSYIFGDSPYFTTSFVKTIKISTPSSGSLDQLVITATITWLNGQTQKTISQETLLTNWRQ